MAIEFDIKTIDFEKVNGLVPAIIQDSETMKVLMMGYMNEEALQKTCAEGGRNFFFKVKKSFVDEG